MSEKKLNRVTALVMMLLFIGSIFFLPNSAKADPQENIPDQQDSVGNDPVSRTTKDGSDTFHFDIEAKAGSGITYRTIGWNVTIGDTTVVYPAESTGDHYSFSLRTILDYVKQQHPADYDKIYSIIHNTGGKMTFNAIQTKLVNGKQTGWVTEDGKITGDHVYTELDTIRRAAGWSDETYKNVLPKYYGLDYEFKPQPKTDLPPMENKMPGVGEDSSTGNQSGLPTPEENSVETDLPDLAVLAITPNSYRGNIKVVTMVKVKNRGPENYIQTQAEDKRVAVEFTANGVKQSVKVDLGPGAVAYLPFEWVTPKTGPVLISAWINPDKGIEEDDYTNNFLQIQATIKQDWEDGNKEPERPDETDNNPNGPLPTSKPVLPPPDGCNVNYREWTEPRIEGYDWDDKLEKWVPRYVNVTFYARLNISAMISEAWPERPYLDGAVSNGFEMKSGYGFQAKVTTSLTTNYDKPELILGPQKVVLFTPETDYGSEVMYFEAQSGTTTWTNTWIMPVNARSHYDNRAWYTPVWFPDNEKYQFFMTAYDAFTPAGPLCATIHKYININGSMYEDDQTITIPITPYTKYIKDWWIAQD